MKRPVKVTEVEGDGLLGLIGQRVFISCCRYSYVGELSGVNDDCVAIKDPAIVYTTGSWNDKSWSDCQKVGTPELFIQIAAIEMFFQTDKS